MPLSNNISHYEDIRHYLDKALESPNGIKIKMPSSGQAVHLRQRLYKLRQLERLASVDIYPAGDERRGCSVWDCLFIDYKLGVSELLIVNRGEPTVEEL